jgi:hypothetical protein
MHLLGKRKKSASDKIAQPYDTTLKTWVKENPKEILPVLLPGAIFQEAVDVERIKPTMRTDRVFKVWYCGTLHILHIEFESGSDTNMPARLNAYNAILYLEYGLPVISIIVYPFRTTMATSPFEVESGDEKLVTFRFKTLPLFTQEATIHPGPSDLHVSGFASHARGKRRPDCRSYGRIGGTLSGG